MRIQQLLGIALALSFSVSAQAQELRPELPESAGEMQQAAAEQQTIDMVTDKVLDPSKPPEAASPAVPGAKPPHRFHPSKAVQPPVQTEQPAAAAESGSENPGVVSGAVGGAVKGVGAVGHGAVTGVEAVGHGAVKGVSAVGHGAEKLGSGVVTGAEKLGSGVVTGAEKVGHGAESVGRGVVTGAEKVGSGVATGTKKVGHGAIEGAQKLGRGTKNVFEAIGRKGAGLFNRDGSPVSSGATPDKSVSESVNNRTSSPAAGLDIQPGSSGKEDSEPSDESPIDTPPIDLPQSWGN